MSKVWLVYVDDCGGVTSPMYLESVHDDEEDAKDEAKRIGGVVVQDEFRGFTKKPYKKTIGGVFSEDWDSCD